MKKIVPRSRWILVRPDGAEKSTEHGIVMPSSVEQEKKATGEVLAVGPDVRDVIAGERVIYGAYCGEEIESGKEKLRLVFDEDVIAFLRDEGN